MQKNEGDLLFSDVYDYTYLLIQSVISIIFILFLPLYWHFLERGNIYPVVVKQYQLFL